MGIFDFFFGKKKSPENANNNASDLLKKVEVASGIQLPKALASHWSEIEKTRLPFISVKATPSEDLSLEQSKLGHFPCLPADFQYPKDEEGKYMYPLAQINFKEVPALDGYPNSGYLQFYISTNDVYGLDFYDCQSQKNFRVLYFEEHEVEKYMADFSFLDEVMQSDAIPVSTSHALTFAAGRDYVSLGDVRAESESFSWSAITDKYPDIDDELNDAICDTFLSNGHKIGGYAYFTQVDPREGNENFKDYILLFQLDSDDKIMWGDVGVANFFIHPDDLAKKDFSKVVYNWDCS